MIDNNENDLQLLAGQPTKEPSFRIDRWPGTMLTALRTNMKCKIAHVADQLEISEASLREYEGKYEPVPFDVIAKAANFFKVSPAAFFEHADWNDMTMQQVLDRVADNWALDQTLRQLTKEQRDMLQDIVWVIFKDTEIRV